MRRCGYNAEDDVEVGWSSEVCDDGVLSVAVYGFKVIPKVPSESMHRRISVRVYSG